MDNPNKITDSYRDGIWRGQGERSYFTNQNIRHSIDLTTKYPFSLFFTISISTVKNLTAVSSNNL